MNTIIISYDLIRPGKDYSVLHNHIQSYGAYAKPLESFWIIKTDFTAEQVRNNLLKYTDVNDKILVINASNKSSAWNNLATNVSDWIKKYF